MAEIVTGVIATVLFFITCWFLLDQIKKHGQAIEQRDEAIRERNEAVKQAVRASRPPITGRNSVSILRRLRNDRKARSRSLSSAEHERD